MVDVERALGNGSDSGTPTAAITRQPRQLRATDSLEDAVHALGSSDDTAIPVLDTDGQLIGWLTHRRLLRAYRERSGQNATIGPRRDTNGAADRTPVATS